MRASNCCRAPVAHLKFAGTMSVYYLLWVSPARPVASPDLQGHDIPENNLTAN
jgi:hypothetical protein